MRNFAKRTAVVLLPLALACCGGVERGISFTDDQGTGEQPVPKNARAELLSFFRTYINNPVGVRDAVLAEPVQRMVGGRLRYVSCVRYTAKDMDGKYQPPQERGVMFVDGRLDRVIENSSEACAGATYQPFTELHFMAR